MDENALRDTWFMFCGEHDCSIDRMLCCPELRNEFIDAANLATGCTDEEQILWSLMALRKKKLLSATSA
ncbi:MAG: hypothetical protein KDA66_20390 [Planctomycetaceae bacterium]|nr:hypothetical protein [Planctomycetaceae bacterium]MCA9115131.1 hypothetical protein [Planctomycetaceae bacterium]